MPLCMSSTFPESRQECRSHTICQCWLVSDSGRSEQGCQWVGSMGVDRSSESGPPSPRHSCLRLSHQEAPLALTCLDDGMQHLLNTVFEKQKCSIFSHNKMQSSWLAENTGLVFPGWCILELSPRSLVWIWGCSPSHLSSEPCFWASGTTAPAAADESERLGVLCALGCVRAVPSRRMPGWAMTRPEALSGTGWPWTFSSALTSSVRSSGRMNGSITGTLSVLVL